MTEQGYRVLVVEQTETPEQLGIRRKEKGSKDKVCLPKDLLSLSIYFSSSVVFLKLITGKLYVLILILFCIKIKNLILDV